MQQAAQCRAVDRGQLADLQAQRGQLIGTLRVQDMVQPRMRVDLRLLRMARPVAAHHGQQPGEIVTHGHHLV